MKKSILTSRLFIVGLVLLLINDFYLKSTYGNWFTGKLSDLAGLFIFPLFFTALFPKKKNVIFIGTTLFFIYWKSSLSTPFISIANEVGLPIGRVIDYSDLLALLILPLAYYYQSISFKSFRLSPALVGIIAFFSFCATTCVSRYPNPFTINKTYQFDYPKAQLIDGLNKLTEDYFSGMGSIDSSKNIIYTFRDTAAEFFTKSDTLCSTCDTIIYAQLISKKISNRDTINYKSGLVRFSIYEKNGKAQLRLFQLAAISRKKNVLKNENQSLAFFEKHVIEKLSGYSIKTQYEFTVGKWISEKDSLYTIITTPTELYEYYNDSLQESYIYKINNYSCDEDYYPTNKSDLTFLQKEDKTGNIECYELYSNTKEIISYRHTTSGKIIVFHRD